MRTGGGERGVARPLSRWRYPIGLSVLAVPVVLSPLLANGDNWVGAVSRLVTPSAEARKASTAAARRRDLAVHPPGNAFKPPVFDFPSQTAVRTPTDAFKAPPVFAPPKPPAFGPTKLPKPPRGVRLPPDAEAAPAFRPRKEKSAWRTVTRKGETAKMRFDAFKEAAVGAGPIWRTSVEPKGNVEAPRFAGGHAGGRPDAAKLRATFQKIREKLSRQDQPPRREAAPKPVAKKTDGADAKDARRRLGSRPVGGLLPPIGSFRPNEVLAINLGPEGLAKVRAANYEALGTVELPQFGLTVTRLRPPDSLNAVAGWDRLYDLLPDGSFALNRVYTPYRLGSGPGSTGGGVHAVPGKGCTADRCFGAQLINWQAPLAACARDVKVGVIDTGFAAAHPAFAGLRYEDHEFRHVGSDAASNRHGTGSLSLLAGHAGSGTPGLIPEAHYVVANAFFADSDGEPVSDTAQMLQALHWLKQKGVAVANLSFAGPEDELMHHGVQELTKAGIVVVAAAGNDGPSAPPSYPAAYEEVIAVTAVDRNLAAYRYASRGDHIDVAAPGVDVWTALPGRREGPQTGTSFAVPFVTAVVAVANGGTGLHHADDPVAAKTRALAAIA